MLQKSIFTLLTIVSAALLASACSDTDYQKIEPFLGAYYGGFDSAESLTLKDDLNPTDCLKGQSLEECRNQQSNLLSHLLLKLDVNADKLPTISLYRTREQYENDTPIELNKACGWTIGPAKTYAIHHQTLAKNKDETQVLFSAVFPINSRGTGQQCIDNARMSARRDQEIDMTLQVNPVTGLKAITLTVEKSARGGNYLYVKQKGKKIPITLDLKSVGTDQREPRLVCSADGKTLLEDKNGYAALCIRTGRKKWSLLLPFAITDGIGPGATAFWGSTRSPKWYRTSDEPDIITYHRAVFIPVEFESLADETNLK